MPWHWSPFIDQKVREAVARELLGGTACFESSKGEALATIPLVGRTESVVATASAKGRIVKVCAYNVAGEYLGSVPAPEVCDRTEVEQGARVTLNIRLT